MTLSATIPALPVTSVTAAADHYATLIGFTVAHLDDGFAIVRRDAAELHLWQSSDVSWRQRSTDDFAACPVRTGAEDFIAGTASCRIAVSDPAALDALHAELAAAGTLHPSDTGTPVDTDHGTRETNAVDRDGNLLTFFVRTAPRG